MVEYFKDSNGKDIMSFREVQEELIALANPNPEFLRPLKECKETLEKLDNEREKNNPYIELANDFKELSNNINYECRCKDNKHFYLYLSSLKDKNRYRFPIDKNNSIEVEIDLLNPFVEIDGEEYIDPRWHFLVSWHAFLDAAWNHPEDENADKIKGIRSKPGRSVLTLPNEALRTYYKEAVSDNGERSVSR